ncbi:MAG: hypothetical protein PHP70_03530 [Gallionella sp.]|nr:hypothetical protein [Gallionella sp.]
MGKIKLAILALGIFFSASSAYAASEVAFPEGWQKWNSISTTLTKIGALPGCDADVSTLPQIYQETVATYCGVRKGGPGKVAVLVNPAVKSAYAARTGKLADGPAMILHLKDMKVLFVTGYKGGKAQYGVYGEDGKDIAAASGPLNADTCRTCHTGYTSFCANGQCGKVSK